MSAYEIVLVITVPIIVLDVVRRIWERLAER